VERVQVYEEGSDEVIGGSAEVMAAVTAATAAPTAADPAAAAARGRERASGR